MRVKKPYTFISHSSKDNDFARQLAVALRRAKIRSWLDLDAIENGERWLREIQQGVEGAQALIVIMSRHARESEWVERETLLALQLRIPIHIAMIDEVPLPLHLIDRQYTPFAADDFDASFERLLPAVQRTLEEAEPLDEPHPLPAKISVDATEDNFFAYLEQIENGEQLALIARELYGWANRHADHVEFGGGHFTPAFHVKVDVLEKQITVFSVLAYMRNPAVQIPLDYLMRYPPITRRRVRLNLLKRLNKLLPEGDELGERRADRRPTLSLLSAFDNADQLEQFEGIISDMMEMLRSGR